MSTELSPLMRGALEATTRKLAGGFRGVYPAGQPLEVVRWIRYYLHDHVAELLEFLDIPLNERLPKS